MLKIVVILLMSLLATSGLQYTSYFGSQYTVKTAYLTKSLSHNCDWGYDSDGLFTTNSEHIEDCDTDCELSEEDGQVVLDCE